MTDRHPATTSGDREQNGTPDENHTETDKENNEEGETMTTTPRTPQSEDPQPEAPRPETPRPGASRATDAGAGRTTTTRTNTTDGATAGSPTNADAPALAGIPAIRTATTERPGSTHSGWTALVLVLLGWLATLALMAVGIVLMAGDADAQGVPFAIGIVLLVVSILAILPMSIVLGGFFTLQPNEARVLVLFGEYRGTIRQTGFHWANPFYSRTLSGPSTQAIAQAVKKATDDTDDSSATTDAVKATVSLRARTLNGPKLKVNDKNGNPIEIATVVVWHVVDTAKAVFDVDHYEQYVSTQSETALRHVASLYAYDHNGDGDEAAAGQITLRSNIIEVSQALKKELSERLGPAGIAVDDARLTHLAYAPEIAQVMLRRQQAEAIIAARTKIVQGAVSMVDMALKELDQDGIVELDEERKASMVSNLMVVLCGDNDAQPVINAGSLYS